MYQECPERALVYGQDEDTQLTQASGVTMSTDDDWGSLTGATPATNG